MAAGPAAANAAVVAAGTRPKQRARAAARLRLPGLAEAPLAGRVRPLAAAGAASAERGQPPGVAEAERAGRVSGWPLLALAPLLRNGNRT
jgi:hypothetical protein